MGVCYIAGAGEWLGDSFVPAAGDMVIAADGGLLLLEAMGVVPDVIVGDFDSLGRVPSGREVVRHPVMKDDTDMQLAVRLGFERGYTRFLIYGGMGGRLDHTLANLQTLLWIERHGGRGLLVRGGQCVTVTGDTLCFSPDASGIISVFPIGGDARGVTLSGLLYPLTDALLSSDAPLGVSNEFTGSAASVSVAHGELAVMWHCGAEALVCE